MSDHESAKPPAEPGDPTHLPSGDGDDLIGSALSHLRGVLSASGISYWQDSAFHQKESLREWASRLGLCLAPDDYIPKFGTGGQEHDIFRDDSTGRIIKGTRNGVFGFTPGIELALVSSSQDARRFHLWEASPYRYLERLHLQNALTPNLNSLEGFLFQPDGDLIIVISQPRFDIVPVTTDEIDAWFLMQGFAKVTDAGYYREADNLAIFDAHDKNLVRAGDTLIPFDVIPVHPTEGFLTFIEETLASGHSVHAVGSTHTTSADPKRSQ